MSDTVISPERIRFGRGHTPVTAETRLSHERYRHRQRQEAGENYRQLGRGVSDRRAGRRGAGIWRRRRCGSRGRHQPQGLVQDLGESVGLAPEPLQLTEIISQRMKLERDGVGGEGTTGV